MSATLLAQERTLYCQRSASASRRYTVQGWAESTVRMFGRRVWVARERNALQRAGACLTNYSGSGGRLQGAGAGSPAHSWPPAPPPWGGVGSPERRALCLPAQQYSIFFHRIPFLELVCSLPPTSTPHSSLSPPVALPSKPGCSCDLLADAASLYPVASSRPRWSVARIGFWLVDTSAIGVGWTREFRCAATPSNRLRVQRPVAAAVKVRRHGVACCRLCNAPSPSQYPHSPGAPVGLCRQLGALLAAQIGEDFVAARRQQNPFAARLAHPPRLSAHCKKSRCAE